MEVLNNTVQPPILVVGKITRSLNHWSSNKFLDPSDRVSFLIDDLNPAELGHVYFWKPTAYQWVLIHMPFKVMDSSTGKLLRGLRSYKTVSPYVNGSLPDKHLKNPKSCIQDFRLSRDDFETFSRRVNSLNGTLTKDEVDSDLLMDSIKALSSRISDFTNNIAELRSRVSLVSSPTFYKSSSDLQIVLANYTDFRELAKTIMEDAVQIVIKIDKLGKESGRETDKVRVSEEYETVKDKLSEFRKIPIDRYEREAIHKSRVDQGEEAIIEKPLFVRELAQEINELKAYYPCLQRLRVISNEEVALDLTGVDVTISAERIIVRGDPGALSAYMSDNVTVNDSVSSRRVRSIIGASDSKK